MEKSHTCVEGGAHLGISVWHLLINLKNNYLLKNWWSEPKKCKNFNINVVFFFNIEKNTLIYDFTHVYLNTWYDLQFLRIIVWQTKIGNYGSVFGLLTNTLHPAKNPKNQNFEKMKKLLEISFYTCVTKTTIIWGMVSEIKWDRQIFLSVWAIFCPFTPLTTQ